MAERRLPVQQLIILSICRFAEPLALTSVFPYLPEMIESFGVGKNAIAKWAGLTSSVFSLAQCLTAIFWGRLSDRFGRKPIILIGLINTMITGLIWGFSTSLPMAITARALAGAGTGNVGILRTVVAELCPWKELQPRAFSIMPLVYNVGSIVGPAFGGALANPLGRTPSDPPGKRFLERFPYALPNLVCACIFLIGITVGFLFLKETHITRRDRFDPGLALGTKIVNALASPIRKAKNQLRGAKGQEVEPLLRESTATDFQVPRAAPVDEESDARKSKGVHHETEASPSFKEVLTAQTCTNLLIYALLAFYTMAFDQVLPVFMHHPVQSPTDPRINLPLKFSGGYGIDSSRIGFLFTMNGIFGMCFQLLIFPPTAQRFGVLRCLRICFIIYPLLFLLTPFSALLPNTADREIAMFIIMLFKAGLSSFAFPCSTILLTNSASSLRILGTLNGIATSAAAICRAAGPALTGAVFTLGVERGYVIAPFWLLAAVSMVAIIPAFIVKEEDGFGDDEGIDAPDSDEYYCSGKSIDGSMNQAGATPSPAYSTKDGDSESESEYGMPGPLLSRTTTASTVSLGEDSDGSETEGPRSDRDWDAEYPDHRHALVVSGSASSGGMQRPPPMRRHRKPRRMSSVPIGLGSGFRRLSSNLGQSMSGYGTGTSWGG